MRNDLHFYKNVCVHKYAVFRDLSLNIFSIFFKVTLENITNTFPRGYAHVSHKFAHIFFNCVLFVPTSDYAQNF